MTATISQSEWEEYQALRNNDVIRAKTVIEVTILIVKTYEWADDGSRLIQKYVMESMVDKLNRINLHDPVNTQFAATPPAQ